MAHLAVVVSSRAETIVREVERHLPVLDQVEQQRQHVAGVEGAGVDGMVAGRLVGPRISTPWCTTSLSARDSSQLPPWSAARSTITEPGRIPSTIAAVSSSGARLPGTRAVVITDVGGGHVCGDDLPLLQELLAHLAA